MLSRFQTPSGTRPRNGRSNELYSSDAGGSLLYNPFKSVAIGEGEQNLLTDGIRYVV